jgi:UDP-glucose 4-epimerase
VIALFIAAMEKGHVPVVHGDGLQSRDFTYVANCVQAIRQAAEAPGVSGQVFNVGTGSSVTVLGLVATLNKLLGTSMQAQHADPRAGDVRYSQADITRTHRDLGYAPAVAFEDGLAKTLAWYRGEKWEQS